MKRESSTPCIHYDPVSGYLHKFRLDDSEAESQPDEAITAEDAADLRLLVAGSIAVSLLLIIGVLTL